MRKRDRCRIVLSWCVAVTVLDATSGAIRGKVLKTAPGNAEKLVP
jgi:hypothetical protein